MIASGAMAGAVMAERPPQPPQKVCTIEFFKPELIV
jgi:hypothetical protein